MAKTVLPFGPQHPVLPEPLHLNLTTEDEIVTSALAWEERLRRRRVAAAGTGIESPDPEHWPVPGDAALATR